MRYNGVPVFVPQLCRFVATVTLQSDEDAQSACLPVWISSKLDNGMTMQCEPCHQICVGHFHPRAGSVMRKHLPLSPLRSQWSTESFCQCPKSTLDTADHGRKQPKRFSMSKLDSRKKLSRQNSVMRRRGDDTFLQPN